ncbi:MAG: PDZ domain-containing protein [Gemmatimonadaceae bacterium]
MSRISGPAPTGKPLGFKIAGPSGEELFVTNLLPGLNADRAGVRNGDRLIALDETPVGSLNPSIFRVAASKSVPVKVVVTRDGKRLEFMVLPQPRPVSRA